MWKHSVDSSLYMTMHGRSHFCQFVFCRIVLSFVCSVGPFCDFYCFSSCLAAMNVYFKPKTIRVC